MGTNTSAPFMAMVQQSEGTKMVTGMHIERHREGVLVPISMDEWYAAVDAIEGVRLTGEGEGEQLDGCGCGARSTGKREGDVEVYFPENDAWYVVFLWTHRGAPTCSLCMEFRELAPPVRAAAHALAARLDAIVVDDDGHPFAAVDGE